MRVAPGAVTGRLVAPASKSMMQRAVAVAALAHGTTRILRPTFCDDGLAALRVAEALGAEVGRSESSVTLRGRVREPFGDLDCGESGLCIRMFSPIAALWDRPMRLCASGSLAGRPVDMLEAPLRQLGVAVDSEGGLPPVRLHGPLRGGAVEVDGAVSSQFLTGLLLALPLTPQDSLVRVPRLTSRPYVRMTLQLARAFGVAIEAEDDLATFDIRGGQRYEARDYTVEGDWSSAAFPLVTGALAGRVTVQGLRLGSEQADRAVLEALALAGAEVAVTADEVCCSRRDLRAFDFDATQCPDLFPPLVALAAGCAGITELRGAGRLAHKESDRAAVLRVEFGKLGVRIEVEGDLMRIHGGSVMGGEVEARGDHRIAMAAATAALISRDGVAIHGEACVAKSYPDFFKRLEELRA